jgi:hypothetical protein
MKRKYINGSLVLVLIASTFVWSGCIKDSGKKTYSYTWFEPVYKTRAEVRANIKSNAATAVIAPGKLFVIGNYIFLNEINKGIHVIDNTNPAAPVNTSFIDIPGNIDIAVKGNILYADLYSDLVVLDVSNPAKVVKVKIVDSVFSNRYYWLTNDSSMIVYDWIRHDTTVVEDILHPHWSPISYYGYNAASFSGSDAGGAKQFSGGGSPTGIAGSMARFALMNNYLYTVGNAALITVDITNPQNPVVSNKFNFLNGNIETIYPFKDKLFIGSTTSMFIYSVANPASPVQMGIFTHARVCDPVIAEDKYAFVTLHEGSRCTGITNELDVVDITDVNNPSLLKKYNLTNPFGLSKDGDLLFICDGKDGLKIFDAKDVNNITLIKQIALPETYDVIAYNGLAIVVARDGLYQFDYSNTANVKQLSKISLSQ